MTSQIWALRADRDPWLAEVATKCQSQYSSDSPYGRSQKNARAEFPMSFVGIQACYEPSNRAFGTTQGEHKKDITGVPSLHEHAEFSFSPFDKKLQHTFWIPWSWEGSSNCIDLPNPNESCANTVMT
jgi:hypothetical protein